MKKIFFSVGVCAYNEADNIEVLIKSILNQKLDPKFEMKELVVVSSASTDGTDEIVERLVKDDKRIILIKESKRRGKSVAVNKFIKFAQSKYLVLASADLKVDKNCLTILLTKLMKKKVGLVGPRIKPLNNSDTLVDFAVRLQWKLHHQINMQFPKRPKVGEFVAFKKLFNRIPPASAVDEASIEPLIHFQDYKVVYCPEAVIYNQGPRNLRDFLRQRRRIYAGHSVLREKYGYSVITYSNMRVLGTLLANMEWRMKYVRNVIMVIGLEAVGRLIGWLDYRFNIRSHAVWKIARSTKQLN